MKHFDCNTRYCLKVRNLLAIYVTIHSSLVNDFSIRHMKLLKKYSGKQQVHLLCIDMIHQAQ